MILKLRMPLFCSWWTIITYLGWSLLGKSEDFDPMTGADFFSESLARILYASFLIMGAILLINMLIALLSNTYQRIEVRLRTERCGRCEDKKNHSLQSYLDTELLKYEHNTPGQIDNILFIFSIFSSWLAFCKSEIVLLSQTSVWACFISLLSCLFIEMNYPDNKFLQKNIELICMFDLF